MAERKLTVNRVLYRCHKTVLEMLQDRGYGVVDELIEMDYEEFEQRHVTKERIIMVVKRPVPGRYSSTVFDEDGNPAQMQEPIFVVFVEQDKISKEIFKPIVEHMENWNEVKKNEGTDLDLFNCILIVKGDSTAIFKKVSRSRITLTKTKS